MMYGNNMGSGGWAVSIVATVIIVALIVAAVLWLASSRNSSRHG
jgi:heme/copper-type cytochrome/quinol oxidase subunit 4